MKTSIRKKDIAIIGMSGKYPQSENLEDFWSNLANGKELVKFYTDEEIKALGALEDNINNPDFIKAIADLEDPYSFDYKFFGYTKAEAMVMDPQIRLMHEQVWLALEHAGYNPKKYSGKIGLYLSAADNVDWRAFTLMTGNDQVNPFYLNQVSNKNFISTLISYNLDLQGPSYYIDTACSSSLVAVHQACRSLLMRECNIAVTGGIRIYSKPYRGHFHQEGMTNSKDGHCRAFSIDSSGIVSGEGVGVIALKTLENAINDGDRIHAVIRSSVVNNDGNRKVGYTAPSITGQYECIKQAHQIAEVEANTITYVEAHGTGTKLGDPVEVEALNKAFNYDTTHNCALGSVKTNIGHLDAAAGVTGLIKTVLALKNQELPPSLHFEQPNPEINFSSGPFTVNTKLTRWECNNGVPRRAGVSSFGIGGNNAHVILEEAPNIHLDTTNDVNSKFLITVSARDQSSLSQYQQSLAQSLENDYNDFPLKNIAYTLGRREALDYGRFSVVKSKEELLSFLKEDENQLSAGRIKSKKKTAFLFSGSGSQYTNMGKGLYEAFPVFKKYIDEGLQTLEKISGLNLSDVVFQEGTGSSKINKNEYTQPIVFIFGYSLAKFLQELGIKPDVMIGHSTGEYIAAAISGVFSFEDALHLVTKRAELMKKTPHGSMLSVTMAADQLEPYLDDFTSISVINAPQSCVVSGRESSISGLYDRLQSEDVECSKLRISVGGHSFLMDCILDDFEQELNKINFSKPSVPFISNLNGEVIQDDEVTTPAYWLKHLRGVVNFSKGIKTLLSEKNLAVIEVGPGNALSTLCKQHAEYTTNHHFVTNVVRHPLQEVNDKDMFLQKLGEIWLQGLGVAFDALYPEGIQKLSLPLYSFRKTKLPAKVDIQSLTSNLAQPGQKIGFHQLAGNEFLGEDEEEIDEEITTRLQNNYVAPNNATEEKLAAIWSDFFAISKVGVQDSFFDIGGNSLKGVTMIKLIQKEFGVKIQMKDFFKKATIEELAKEVDIAQGLAAMQINTKAKNTIKI